MQRGWAAGAREGKLFPGWPMSCSSLCSRGPRVSVQAAQGTVVHHLQVHLVADQLPDIVDAIFDHCWAWDGRRHGLRSGHAVL